MSKSKLEVQPNLFLIGGMRCGSTSLHLLLDQHPDIFMSLVKEPQYYIAEAMRRMIDREGNSAASIAKLNSFVRGGKHRNLSSYQSLFPSAGTVKYVGESSHYLYHPVVAQVIKDDCPDARIIVSLRNPVERLYSEYLRSQRTGRTGQTFSEFVYQGCTLDEEGRLIELEKGRSKIGKGLYYLLVKEWVDVFGLDKVKLVLFEEFKQDYGRVLKSIFTWLDIDPTFMPVPVHAQRGGIPRTRNVFEIPENLQFARKILKRLLSRVVRERLRAIWYKLFLKQTEMQPEIRSFLEDVYRSDIEHLESEFKLDLSLWQ